MLEPVQEELSNSHCYRIMNFSHQGIRMMITIPDHKHQEAREYLPEDDIFALRGIAKSTKS